MAGHSKWANIKHRKMRSDAKKGKIFSQMAKEIISAVKQGGPDPKGNTRLKLAIQKARAANVPSDNIERNIKKASSADQADFFEMQYELYGYGGVGILVDIMTDNKNRTASDMRIATNKRGGNIAAPGAVAYNFDKKGIIHVPKDQSTEEDLFLLVTEAGAEDFEVVGDLYVITTPPDQLMAVKDILDEKNIQVEECSLQMIPQNYVECDEEAGAANLALIEWLEEIEDVTEVYHNMAFD
ncbi:MAG: YebC/PmpR family DNA-binding transcriptional regulator [Simkaniaceae bacterium]|nr:YebC/PmpR family DNA-binding transcriptional regulator [Simkaniaceae bacterium]MCF7851651.1 YebC/PmpR family DNA-binding transcriptional regulator [Simkaniaceae bacterium]